jgi:hypothetical protein
MPKILNQKDIDEYRRIKWHLKLALRITSELQAIKFINNVGMSLLFACQDIPLPKMAQSAQSDEWDWWEWKDTLQAKKKWYNSRVVKKKATLLSMELLPCFLSLYYKSGGCEVYDEEYYYGKLTEPAYRIADYLFTHGPTSVDDLRKALASPGKKGTRRFHDAIKELQTKFKIAVCGLEDKHWGVRVLGLFSQWAPKDILKQAESMKPEIARQQILQTFISTSALTTEKEIIRLFGWSPESVHESLQYLIEINSIHTAMLRQRKELYYTIL